MSLQHTGEGNLDRLRGDTQGSRPRGDGGRDQGKQPLRKLEEVRKGVPEPAGEHSPGSTVMAEYWTPKLGENEWCSESSASW